MGVLYNPLKGTVAESRQAECDRAKIEDLSADMAYIAMMCDLQIFEEGEEVERELP